MADPGIIETKDLLVHGWNCEKPISSVFFNRIEYCMRIKLRHYDVGSAQQRRRVQEGHSPGVIHRRQMQIAIAISQSERDDLRHRCPYGTVVIQQHTLGSTGGTRGVENERVILLHGAILMHRVAVSAGEEIWVVCRRSQ